MVQVPRTLPSSTATETSRFDGLWFVASTATPVMMLSFFGALHVHHWLQTGSLNGLALGLQEAVLVCLFLIRRRPSESTNTFSAWIAAVCGGWGLLLLNPSGTALVEPESLVLLIQFVGAALSVIATLFLGRSFGIVAANRGVKTNGAYKIVRHPIYASYLISVVGYLLASFSVWNLAVIVVVLAFQLRRIGHEEAVLMRTPEYRAYAEQTTYRLIPGIY